MKNAKSIPTRTCLSGLLTLLFILSWLSNSAEVSGSDETNQVLNAQSKKTAKTNGYCAELRVRDIRVSVYALRDTAVTGSPQRCTNHPYAPPYLIATNWFCGPVSLLDSNNVEVSCLKPNVNLSNAYPDLLDWEALKIQFFTNCVGWQSGESIPGDNTIFEGLDLLGVSNSKDKICDFSLKDYFDLKSSGDYTLTVWGKLYERSKTNSNIFQRIDLAPVSNTVHVN